MDVYSPTPFSFHDDPIEDNDNHEDIYNSVDSGNPDPPSALSLPGFPASSVNSAEPSVTVVPAFCIHGNLYVLGALCPRVNRCERTCFE